MNWRGLIEEGSPPVWRSRAAAREREHCPDESGRLVRIPPQCLVCAEGGLGDYSSSHLGRGRRTGVSPVPIPTSKRSPAVFPTLAGTRYDGSIPILQVYSFSQTRSGAETYSVSHPL